MTPKELKKEFYDKFVMKGEPQMILLRDEVEELFQWIETQITKAKIEELEYWREFIFGVEETVSTKTIGVIDFVIREVELTKQLEAEK